MKAQDVIRKMRLLRKVRPENGASETEAGNAPDPIAALMRRYSIGTEDVGPGAKPVFRQNWTQWETVLKDFGLQLRRFGGRGNAMIGRDRIVYIKLDTGQWWMDRKSPGGLETVTRDIGIESLHAYLRKNVSRPHAFFRR